jgi:hypothetical protein
MSKTMLRSGVANPPKFSRCASPQACTITPELGLCAKSAAMIAADPRKKAKGDCTIRPKRMGMSCGNLPLFDSIRSSTGSLRPLKCSQPL